MNKNNNNIIINYPFSNEIKQLKEEYKRMIDEMSDMEFIAI